MTPHFGLGTSKVKEGQKREGKEDVTPLSLSFRVVELINQYS
jgi:hypothetical protein